MRTDAVPKYHRPTRGTSKRRTKKEGGEIYNRIWTTDDISDVLWFDLFISAVSCAFAIENGCLNIFLRVFVGRGRLATRRKRGHMITLEELRAVVEFVQGI